MSEEIKEMWRKKNAEFDPKTTWAFKLCSKHASFESWMSPALKIGGMATDLTSFQQTSKTRLDSNFGLPIKGHLCKLWFNTIVSCKNEILVSTQCNSSTDITFPRALSETWFSSVAHASHWWHSWKWNFLRGNPNGRFVHSLVGNIRECMFIPMFPFFFFPMTLCVWTLFEAEFDTDLTALFEILHVPANLLGNIAHKKCASIQSFKILLKDAKLILPFSCLRCLTFAHPMVHFFQVPSLQIMSTLGCANGFLEIWRMGNNLLKMNHL